MITASRGGGGGGGDGISKCLIKIFQEAIASGKKLFMYLFDLHIISRKALRMFPLNKAL